MVTAERRAKAESLLVAAERRWAQHAPESYRFRLTEQRFRPQAPSLEVVVRRGTIVRFTFMPADSIQNPAVGDTGGAQPRTIPALFQEIHAVLADAAWQVTVAFDSVWGYPTRFVTGHSTITDIGRSITVSQFHPLAH